MRLYEFYSVYAGNMNIYRMLFDHNLRNLGEKLTLGCTYIFCGKRIKCETFGVFNTVRTLAEVFVIADNFLNGICYELFHSIYEWHNLKSFRFIVVSYYYYTTYSVNCQHFCRIFVKLIILYDRELKFLFVIKVTDIGNISILNIIAEVVDKSRKLFCGKAGLKFPVKL